MRAQFRRLLLRVQHPDASLIRRLVDELQAIRQPGALVIVPLFGCAAAMLHIRQQHVAPLHLVPQPAEVVLERRKHVEYLVGTDVGQRREERCHQQQHGHAEAPARQPRKPTCKQQRNARQDPPDIAPVKEA